jgi:eukaryotic-like serine/threonine-protein kinase
MDPERWERVQTLFHDALDRPEPDRATFLDQACSTDADLKSQVLAMLEEDRRSSVLDTDMASVAANLLDSPPTKKFGPYRLGRLLGEGGMGVVYQAERDDLGSAVAIKILRDAWMSPARRARFAAEQRTLAGLNHPSIARLYDADTLDDETPFFVMEYVDGVPLTTYCRDRQLSIEDRLSLFRSVCEAVEYAHRHAVIHRDLKPSNILVKPDGTPKLLDFGIAKQLDPHDTPSDQTRTGLRLMTPAYAAPEQLRGTQVGIGTDVYSLGVILYELIAARLPFDLTALAAGDAERLVLETEPARPSGADEDLDVLCLTAMHKDPERRYRSVEALIRDVDHYLRGEPLEARPDTLRYRVSKFVRRNRRAVILSALGAAAVLGLVIFFTVRLAAARNAALAEAARTRRIQEFMLDLFDGGDKSAGPSNDLRITTLLDRGVQSARSLDADPPVQTELFATLGGMYQKLGNLDQADALFNAALVRRRTIGDTHLPESLADLALLRADQARIDEAEKLAKQGVEAAQQAKPRDDLAVAKALVALGTVLESKGDYTAAIAPLQQAVDLESARSVTLLDSTAALTELGSAHFYAGHLDRAETLTQRVLQMDRQLHGDHHPSVAEDLSLLGAIAQERGQYPQAGAFCRQALDTARAFYGNDHSQIATKLTTLSRVLILERRFDEAVDLLRQALAIQERVYGPDNPAVASVLNEIGNIAYMRDQYDEAEARFTRALNIYKTVYHDHHSFIAVALSNIASVYMDRKDFPHAEKLFREAVQRFTDTQGADHINTAIAQIKLGRVILRQHRYREAEVQTLAGYGTLSKQASPSVTWLKSARKSMVEIYDATKEPEKAAQYKN